MNSEESQIVVMRVYKVDADRLRNRFPQYRSDAERLNEIMQTIVTVTTLPRPVDAQSIPAITTQVTK